MVGSDAAPFAFRQKSELRQGPGDASRGANLRKRGHEKMRSMMLFAVYCATISVAFGDVSWTEYFKDSLPSSGTVTISSGDSVVMNDAEMEATKSCTVNVSEGAVLKLDTSAPPAFAFGTKCYGTVEKISSASWPIAARNQSNFKGIYVISAGSVKINGTFCKIFGSVDNLDESKLYRKTHLTNS